MSHQFRSGGGGGKRIADTVGAGAKDWDEKAKALISEEVKARARRSVGDMLVNQSIRASESPPPSAQPGQSLEELDWGDDANDDLTVSPEEETDILPAKQRGIFDGLVIYINGSTHPLISDHKLKHLLAENGARMSIHLGRRSVTHVILGRPCGTVGGDPGSGGGLAGTKIQKEIRRVGGCGVKYVGVEWILDSIKQGKRLPEARFANLKTAAPGQKSVYSMFSKKEN